MKYKSYIVARDYGFAPNPFGKHCTLACCKQKIRANVTVGDWVFGIGSKQKGMHGKLVFAMHITEILTFQEYWEDQRFEYKKPIMNGSLIQLYGDNIYHKDDESGEWLQENSHHSLENGTVNGSNLERDISGKNVLISDLFYYFGKSAVEVPNRLRELCRSGRGHRNVDDSIANEFIDWLSKNYKPGRYDNPLLFNDTFERYDGVS